MNTLLQYAFCLWHGYVSPNIRVEKYCSIPLICNRNRAPHFMGKFCSISILMHKEVRTAVCPRPRDESSTNTPRPCGRPGLARFSQGGCRSAVHSFYSPHIQPMTQDGEGSLEMRILKACNAHGKLSSVLPIGNISPSVYTHFKTPQLSQVSTHI